MKATPATLTILGGIALAAVLILGWPLLLALALLGLVALLMLGFAAAVGAVFARVGECALGSPDVEPTAPEEPVTADLLENFDAETAARQAEEEAARVQRRIDREAHIANLRAQERERQAWEARMEEMERFSAETQAIVAKAKKAQAERMELLRQHREKRQAETAAARRAGMLSKK